MGKNEVDLELLSGLAIFLLGMRFLEGGFKCFGGSVLEVILRKFSSTRLKSVTFGTVKQYWCKASRL